MRPIAILLLTLLHVTWACTDSPPGIDPKPDSGSNTDSDSDSDSDTDYESPECQDLTDEETCLWCLQTSPTEEELLGVWGAAHDDVFAVGSNGVIVHYNGTEWSLMESGTTAQLNAVWGSGTDDVFAVGEDCVILHFDGWGWSPMEGPDCGSLRDVSGTGPQHVIAVGEAPEIDPNTGVVIQFDGTVWSEMEVGPFVEDSYYNTPQYGVWSSAADDVYVVGGYENGTVLHFDGSEWSVAFVHDGWDSSNACRSIWGTANGEVLVGGDEPVCLALRYDGETWEPLDVSVSAFDVGIHDVAGASESSAFSVGWVLPTIHKGSDWVTFIAEYDGEGWNPLPVGWCYDELFSLWVASESEAFAVGTEGLIVHYSAPD